MELKDCTIQGLGDGAGWGGWVGKALAPKMTLFDLVNRSSLSTGNHSITRHAQSVMPWPSTGLNTWVAIVIALAQKDDQHKISCSFEGFTRA